MNTNIHYYDSIVQEQPTRTTTIKETYHNVKNGAYSLQTHNILDTYFDGIVDNWKGHDKDPYQNLKRETLHAVTFSGLIDRHTGYIDSHTGLITLDIDSNPKEVLNGLFERITDGCDAAIDACALSVSGIVNGSMWANVRVTIPSNPKTKLSKKLKKLVGIVDGDNRSEAITKLHKAFYRAIAHRFTTKYGIKLATTQNPKRTRYLSDDPNIYINPHDTNRYTLQFLEKFLTGEKKAKKKAKKFDKVTTDINTTDAYSFAYQFAKNKGTDFVKGEKHNFRMFFAVACNLLGVSQSDCTDHIQEHYPSGNGKLGNCITSPYKNYAATHGMWAYKLKPLQSTIHVPKGKYLSDVVSEIMEHYKRELLMGNRPKFCLKGSTSIGKTYATVEKIAPQLTAMTGKKVIFICNLNLLTKQTADKGDVQGLTRTPNEETLLKAFNNDFIVCNHDAFDTVAKYCIDNNIRLHIFFDESQSLIDGMSFKAKKLIDVLQYADFIGASITLLSATPKDYFLHVGFKRIEITDNNQTPIKLIKVFSDAPVADLTIQHILNTDFSSKKILLIKIQSIKKIKQIYKSLLNLGYTKKQVLMLYSDNEIKETDYYKRIEKSKKDEETFDDEVLIILTTSIINEGVNVYSSTREFEFINFERNQYFRYLDLIQFIARWRTTKSKLVYSYHKPITTDYEISPDAHIKAFTELFESWSNEAKSLNSSKNTHFTETKISTFSTTSHVERYIIYNKLKGKYVVNVLACAAYAENIYNKNLPTDEAYKRLQSEFPNIEIIEGNPPTIQKEIQEITQEQKELTAVEKEKAIEQLNTLFHKDIFILLAAFNLKSDSTTLIEKGRFHFPEVQKKTIHYNEWRTQAVEAINANKELFIENFSLVQKFVYYVCKVLDVGFKREHLIGFLTDGKGNIRSYQKLTGIFDKLNTWRLLYVGSKNDKENYLKDTQLKELKQYQSIQEKILKAVHPTKKEITVKKALIIVYKSSIKGYTQKRAKHLINKLFECHKPKNKAVYVIESKNDFFDLFSTINLSFEQNVKIVDNLLIVKGKKGSSNDLLFIRKV